MKNNALLVFLILLVSTVITINKRVIKTSLYFARDFVYVDRSFLQNLAIFTLIIRVLARGFVLYY